MAQARSHKPCLLPTRATLLSRTPHAKFRKVLLIFVDFRFDSHPFAPRSGVRGRLEERHRHRHGLQRRPRSPPLTPIDTPGIPISVFLQSEGADRVLRKKGSSLAHNLRPRRVQPSGELCASPQPFSCPRTPSLTSMIRPLHTTNGRLWGFSPLLPSGMGFNARAALITRGLAEISRLAVAKGGRPITMLSLAGVFRGEGSVFFYQDWPSNFRI